MTFEHLLIYFDLTVYVIMIEAPSIYLKLLRQTFLLVCVTMRTREESKKHFSFFSFFPSCFMFIYNPLGYDRPERLYIHDLARLDTPYLSISALSRRVIIRDIWGFSPPEIDFSDLVLEQFLACLIIASLPL